MSEQPPLERAARALCQCEQLDPDELFGVAGAEYPRWHLYKEPARAVLMAIREPKGGMISAGAKHSLAHKDGPEDNILNRLNAMAIYTAMIDAALSEKS